MRTRIGTIHIVVLAALAVGAAAGWFAAGARGKNKCENVEVCKYGNMETANAVDKPRRKALIRSSADAEVQKRILENKISHLEKCIAAAKSLDAQPTEKKRETNAEIVARLMKLPTDNERYFAFTRLDEKTQMSLTIGELKKICPRQMTIDEELSPAWADVRRRT